MQAQNLCDDMLVPVAMEAGSQQEHEDLNVC